MAAVTCISVKSLCFPNLFFICLFMFSTAILQCSTERRPEVQDQFVVNSIDSCLEEGNDITDFFYTTLVSPGKKFECGFFSPENNKKNGRYLGIWYYEQNPKTVVWVANRDKPLLGSNGYLILKDGNAMLLDKKNVTYWSTRGVSHTQRSNISFGTGRLLTNKKGFALPPIMQPFSTRKLCLLDTGNLVLNDRSLHGVDQNLWQSFEHPTDTLLPGMTLGGKLSLPSTTLSLRSWKNHSNTSSGNFKFPLQPNRGNKLSITDIAQKGHAKSNYWQSEATPFDKLPSALSSLWFYDNTPLPNNTRLVMNFTGQLQFWTLENETGWSLNWSEPKDGCSTYDRCGNFASCNSNNGWSCKCLPGFKPYSEDLSGGCSQKSGLVCERNDFSSDMFLKLHKMKLGNTSCLPSSSSSSTDEDCRVECLNKCHCVAYSTDFADCSLARSSEKGCLIWTDDLIHLQENILDGITIFVRANHFDIDNTSRGCWPCGTYIIPYPLSTGRDCGDSKYSNFYCNETTGQVYFSTPSRNITVTSIDPDANSFNITIMHASCDNSSSVLSLNPSLPFIEKGCELIKDQPFTETQQPFIEVEIGWKPPQEFSCNVSSDCKLWPHTSCKRTKEGEMRCICGSKFHWNGKTLNCMRVHFPRKYVVLCSAGALAIFLGGIAFLVYLMRKRRMARGKGLLELKEDDTEGIDVPFFDWDNILAATNNFADANRLGTGGFGSVYMGKLSDGKVIAVKRLSSVSVQGVEEFRTEVLLIAKLQHRNLVKLLGYCMKGDEKILVYEFMSNGSLDSCLFDEQHSVYLDWKKRFEIILGIARGLLYLHQDSRLRIIHRDLKPSNILLDEELNPKISDFGIARIVGGKETQASTGRVVGTYGYMSPEYASDGIFSVKSDVFSFGVVILETVSGRRNSRIYMFEHGLSLLGHAWKLWNEEKGLEIMDSKLNESCLLTEVQKCIHIGLLCVQEDPSDRPTMSTVVYMLSGENAPLPPAKQPAFMNRKPLSESASSSSVRDLSMQQEMMTVSTVGR